jgi:hypothetical protein
MQRSDNVLQYEFFHVGGKDTGSLDDTGLDIKTVVRIYDTDGQVTLWVKQVKDLKAQREVHCNVRRSNPIINWYARWQIGRLNQRIHSVNKLIVEYFAAYVRVSFGDELPIARETRCYTFRLARRDEYTELLHAWVMAKSLRVFTFRPNDLLAERNQVVASTTEEEKQEEQCSNRRRTPQA